MSQVTTSQIRDILTKTVDSFDGSGVSDDQSLSDAGMDSLDKASLFLAIEEQLSVKISDDVFEELDSISAIAEQVSEIMSAGQA